MHQDSPYYEWHRDSIGWLHRRHRFGEFVSKQDVQRLVEIDPSLLNDNVMQIYARKVIFDELKPKRGRPSKRHSMSYACRMLVAEDWVAEKTLEIREARKAAGIKGGRTLLEPCVEAADFVGGELGLPRGRSLLNEISAFKSRFDF